MNQITQAVTTMLESQKKMVRTGTAVAIDILKWMGWALGALIAALWATKKDR
jgi:hypothetical protein